MGRCCCKQSDLSNSDAAAYSSERMSLANKGASQDLWDDSSSSSSWLTWQRGGRPVKPSGEDRNNLMFAGAAGWEGCRKLLSIRFPPIQEAARSIPEESVERMYSGKHQSYTVVVWSTLSDVNALIFWRMSDLRSVGDGCCPARWLLMRWRFMLTIHAVPMTRGCRWANAKCASSGNLLVDGQLESWKDGTLEIRSGRSRRQEGWKCKRCSTSNPQATIPHKTTGFYPLCVRHVYVHDCWQSLPHHGVVFVQ